MSPLLVYLCYQQSRRNCKKVRNKENIAVVSFLVSEGSCIKAMKKSLDPIILVMGKPVPIKPNPYIRTCNQEGFFASKQCNKTSGESWGQPSDSGRSNSALGISPLRSPSVNGLCRKRTNTAISKMIVIVNS